MAEDPTQKVLDALFKKGGLIPNVLDGEIFKEGAKTDFGVLYKPFLQMDSKTKLLVCTGTKDALKLVLRVVEHFIPTLTIRHVIEVDDDCGVIINIGDLITQVVAQLYKKNYPGHCDTVAQLQDETMGVLALISSLIAMALLTVFFEDSNYDPLSCLVGYFETQSSKKLQTVFHTVHQARKALSVSCEWLPRCPLPLWPKVQDMAKDKAEEYKDLLIRTIQFFLVSCDGYPQPDLSKVDLDWSKLTADVKPTGPFGFKGGPSSEIQTLIHNVCSAFCCPNGGTPGSKYQPSTELRGSSKCRAGGCISGEKPIRVTCKSNKECPSGLECDETVGYCKHHAGKGACVNRGLVCTGTDQCCTSLVCGDKGVCEPLSDDDSSHSSSVLIWVIAGIILVLILVGIVLYYRKRR